jgi:hypothetical protein
MCKLIFILSEIYLIFIFFFGGGGISYLSGSKTGAILSDNEKLKDMLHLLQYTSVCCEKHTGNVAKSA